MGNNSTVGLVHLTMGVGAGFTRDASCAASLRGSIGAAMLRLYTIRHA